MTLTTRLFSLLSLGLLAVSGCQPRGGRSDVQERELMHSSFEDLEGWSDGPQPNLTTEKAHTGRVSTFIDANHEYSVTYRKELGGLCDHRPRRITFSAWVWVPTPEDDAVFVVVVNNPNDPDHPTLSKNVFMTPTGSFGKWKQVSRSFELPPDIHSNSQLVIYLWRANARDKVYSDDWQLTELW